MSRVLILGSGPDALKARDWPRGGFDVILAINNAWQVRPDWDVLIHPEDFAEERRPNDPGPGQRIVTAEEYVPAQNSLGGFVYAGGTMAFTAGYWALAALRPRLMAYFACDMVYPEGEQTHFYGTGAADPLRRDVTLRSLEAKSARLMLMAAERGCAVVNLSQGESRQVFPRAGLGDCPPPVTPGPATARAREAEEALGYMEPSGRYWEVEERFDVAEIDRIDTLWLSALAEVQTL